MNIALFLSHQAGEDIASFFRNRSSVLSENIFLVFLTGDEPELELRIKEILSGYKNEIRYISGRKEIQTKGLSLFSIFNIEAIVTVYWPWLISSEMLQYIKVSCNFHPSLLPLNRGWYPHVYNIINGSAAGVTLHEISDGPDTGNIYIQKEFPIYLTDTASDLYKRLMNGITRLFIENWDLIASGKLIGIPQDHSLATYNKKVDLEKFNQVYLDEEYSLRQLLRILRARTFNDRSYAFFIDNGESYSVRVVIEKTENVHK
jgi:methionyl-tRNA formyltransferase